MGNLVPKTKQPFSWLKIFAPENFFIILINPLWLWYILLVFIIFSYSATPLPKDIALVGGSELFLNIVWFLGSCAISVEYIIAMTDEKYRSSNICGSITMISALIMLVFGLCTMPSAVNIFCYNSVQLLGHSLAWLGIIVLPFALLFVGHLFYQLSSSIKLND